MDLINKKNTCCYIIIGLGASGIATAIQLKKKNISFLILEKQSRFGGCWNNALETSTLQTYREFYKFKDVNYDKNTSDFPNKSEILSYFRKAINQFDLGKHIIYNYHADISKINSTLNEPSLNWKIKNKNKNKNTEVFFATHIMLCIGLNNKPKIPNISRLVCTIPNLKKKVHPLKVMHSCELDNFINLNKDYFNTKKKIVVIGNGASSCDILKYLNINKLSHEILVFYRTNKFYFPKYILGFPGSFFLNKIFLKFFERIPTTINNILIFIANIILLGNLLDNPQTKINSVNIVGTQIIQKLIAKQILTYHKENVIAYNERYGIVKSDQAIYTDVDMLIFATGYKDNRMSSFEYLYNYVVPINNFEIAENNIGYIGFNKTYNFIQNKTSYKLSSLIEELNSIKNLKRVRFTTSHPKDMTDDLIGCFKKYEKLMPFLHLPIQSGSDKVLRAMNRKHDKKYYFSVIEKLKKANKDIEFSSDFIIGYPGETKKDFEDTIELVKKVGFINSYSFIFSPRPGTPAANKKTVNIDESKNRLIQLQSILENFQSEYNKKFVNKYCEVLIENKVKNQNKFFGRTKNMVPVIFEAENCEPGKLLNIKINSYNRNNLFGTHEPDKTEAA